MGMTIDEAKEPTTKNLDGYEKGLSVLEDIKAEIEQVRTVMDDEIIEHDRKDIINFVNGLNQCLCIIDKHCGKEQE